LVFPFPYSSEWRDHLSICGGPPTGTNNPIIPLPSYKRDSLFIIESPPLRIYSAIECYTLSKKGRSEVLGHFYPKDPSHSFYQHHPLTLIGILSEPREKYTRDELIIFRENYPSRVDLFLGG